MVWGSANATTTQPYLNGSEVSSLTCLNALISLIQRLSTAMHLIPAVSEDLLWRRRSSLTTQIQTPCSASYPTIPLSPPLSIPSIKTVLPIFHLLAPNHPRPSISVLQMRRNRNRPSNTIAQVAPCSHWMATIIQRHSATAKIPPMRRCRRILTCSCWVA